MRNDLAVLRLTRMWNFVGSVTGNSADFSPFTIRLLVAGLPIGIGSAGAVADEAAGFRLLAIGENRREGLTSY
jgi:hypothetical protein